MRVILDTENLDQSALDAVRVFLRKHAPGFVHVSNKKGNVIHVATDAQIEEYYVRGGRVADIKPERTGDRVEVDRNYNDYARLIRVAPRHRSVCGHLVAEVDQVTTEPVTCGHCATWLAGYKHALGLADD